MACGGPALRNSDWPDYAAKGPGSAIFFLMRPAKRNRLFRNLTGPEEAAAVQPFNPIFSGSSAIAQQAAWQFAVDHIQRIDIIFTQQRAIDDHCINTGGV